MAEASCAVDAVAVPPLAGGGLGPGHGRGQDQGRHCGGLRHVVACHVLFPLRSSEGRPPTGEAIRRRRCRSRHSSRRGRTQAVSAAIHLSSKFCTVPVSLTELPVALTRTLSLENDHDLCSARLMSDEMSMALVWGLRVIWSDTPTTPDSGRRSSCAASFWYFQSTWAGQREPTLFDMHLDGIRRDGRCPTRAARWRRRRSRRPSASSRREAGLRVPRRRP